MTNLKIAGKRIKALRTKAPGPLKQIDLAVAIGVSRSTIAGIEAGGDSGGLATMVAIADYFKVPLDWLINRTVPPGGPLAAQFVDDPDELAWLAFWKSLSPENRRAITHMLSISYSGSRVA